MKDRIINNLLIIMVSLGIASCARGTEDMYTWANYANNLKNCSPGIYQLPNPSVVSFGKVIKVISNNKLKTKVALTNQISGWKKGKCVVIQTTLNPTDATPKTIIRCAYEKNDLLVMAKSAEEATSANVNVSNNDASKLIVNKSCSIIKAN